MTVKVYYTCNPLRIKTMWLVHHIQILFNQDVSLCKNAVFFAFTVSDIILGIVLIEEGVTFGPSVADIKMMNVEVKDDKWCKKRWDAQNHYYVPQTFG